jgi:hypothetical protein
MMTVLDVLNAHEFFQNYLNHFCFDLEFSFSMSIWMLWNCLWLPLHMKCLCLMILLWSFLGHVNMCLKLHCVEFQLLFWIFSSPLTLGFDLVVCTYKWALNFRFKHPNSMVNVASSFECWYLLLIANICVFCRSMITHLSLPHGLCVVHWDCLFVIDCCLFVWVLYWFV